MKIGEEEGELRCAAVRRRMRWRAVRDEEAEEVAEEEVGEGTEKETEVRERVRDVVGEALVMVVEVVEVGDLEVGGCFSSQSGCASGCCLLLSLLSSMVAIADDDDSCEAVEVWKNAEKVERW